MIRRAVAADAPAPAEMFRALKAELALRFHRAIGAAQAVTRNVLLAGPALSRPADRAGRT